MVINCLKQVHSGNKKKGINLHLKSELQEYFVHRYSGGKKTYFKVGLARSS